MLYSHKSQMLYRHYIITQLLIQQLDRSKDHLSFKAIVFTFTPRTPETPAQSQNTLK